MGKCQAVTASIEAPVVAAMLTAQRKASLDCPDPSTPTTIRAPLGGVCVVMMFLPSVPVSCVHSVGARREGHWSLAEPGSAGIPFPGERSVCNERRGCDQPGAGSRAGSGARLHTAA